MGVVNFYFRRKGMKNDSGFTLIEIIMVIVILGVLAIVAMPRFVDLSSSARVSALKGLKGAIASAATIFKSKAIITGIANDASTTLVEGGITVDMEYGAPAPTATGIVRVVDANMAADLSGDYVYSNRNDELLVSPSDLYSSVPNNAQIVASKCYLIYYQELPNKSFRVWIANSNGC